MSMTQEEIEALMNDTSFSQDEDNVDEVINDDNIDDLLKGINETDEEENIDDILAGIDGVIEDGSDSSVQEDSNIDDILAGIDGIVDDDITTQPPADDIKEEKQNTSTNNDQISNQIDQGVYPLPVSNEHQVVNQLNEVAEDSEEKASQIFDVLSFILDENDKIQKNISDNNKFIDSQLELLETLCKKFPNITLFLDNLETAQNIKTKNSEILDIVEQENNKVFEAMELMQYHDINRQKIERVMAVIRKLANYLSGIFSDDSNKPEVQIAKHISGDGSDTVNEDDLDSLIAEFNTKA